MRPVQILFDENIEHAFYEALLLHAPSIRTLIVGVEGAPPKGTDDPDLMLWCMENRFIYITHDKETTMAHYRAHLAAGHESWGVISLSDQGPAFKDCLDDLLAVALASTAEDWRYCFEYLPWPRRRR